LRISIRPAGSADAAGIAEVHVSAWQAAYRGEIPDDYLASMDVDVSEAKWRRALASPAATPFAFLVAEADARIAGFASAAPSRDADAARGVGELWALYVRPPEWGRGIGTLLLRGAEKWLLTSGFGSATLWVLSGNPRARRFYEARGWAPDGGAKQEERGGRIVDEVRYRRVLG
jgi:GNAT superfamily N-acetyltransferase